VKQSDLGKSLDPTVPGYTRIQITVACENKRQLLFSDGQERVIEPKRWLNAAYRLMTSLNPQVVYRPCLSLNNAAFMLHKFNTKLGYCSMTFSTYSVIYLAWQQMDV
jgi:hypothetical protein